MSGPAERTADPGGRRSGIWHGVWVGLVIGVIVVSGALVAVLHGPGSDDSDARRDSPQRLDEPTEVTHEFPAGYVGQVWVTITAPDAAPREVTISWGPWNKHLVHRSAEPKTYWFTRDAATSEADNIPATVHVEPGAEVTFDQGMVPVGAVDASIGWERSPTEEAVASDGD